MRLRSSVIEVDQLSLIARQEMFLLMKQCFENIHWETFEIDLNSKWLVIQLHDPSGGRLVGFSTQVMLKATVEGTPVRALFSGDTVVSPAHWGDPALAHEWGQLALRLIDQQRPESLYWFLTSKGFRTYRFLPVFFREYFPRVKGETSGRHKAVVDAFGPIVGGERYDSARQIICATPDKDFVRKEVSNPESRLRNDPHIRFFVNQNPGYDRGDELCCVAPLSRENFTRAAYRVINAPSVSEEVP